MKTIIGQNNRQGQRMFLWLFVHVASRFIFSQMILKDLYSLTNLYLILLAPSCIPIGSVPDHINCDPLSYSPISEVDECFIQSSKGGKELYHGVCLVFHSIWVVRTGRKSGLE